MRVSKVFSVTITNILRQNGITNTKQLRKAARIHGDSWILTYRHIGLKRYKEIIKYLKKENLDESK